MQDLRTSIEGYRTATSLSESLVLHLDSGYNLAQSLIALADILEDTDGGAADVLILRNEAATVLGQVLDGQESFLARQAEEGDTAIEQAEDGAENEAMDIEAESKGDDAEDEEERQDEGEGGEGSFETYLPTPSTMIDTVLSIVDLHMSMWESAEPLASPSETSQSLVRSVLDRGAKVCPVDRQAELDLAEIKVLLSVDGIVWDLYRSEAQVGTGVESSLEGATIVLSKLLSSLPEQGSSTVQAEILTMLADTHTTIADRQVYLLPQLPAGPSHLAQQAWYHHSQTVTQLSKALELPTSAETPREFKPSVLLNLAKASLERARLRRVNDTAKRNAVQLMDNAWTYASRAAEGLAWRPLALSSSTSAIGSSGAELPPPAGWDTESLGRDIVFTSLRLCFVGANTDILPEDSRGKYHSGLQALMAKLQSVTLTPDRRIGGKDLQSRVDELRDDVNLEDGEDAFWTECIAQLGPVV